MADPDVFTKAKCTKGDEYWSYMLVYVDDCLLNDHDPGPVMEELKKEYNLKNDAYGRPERYLGATIDPYTCTDGKTHWSMPPRHYLKEARKTVSATRSEQEGRRWTKRKVPMIQKYRPAIDISDELGDDLAYIRRTRGRLGDDLASRFQQYMGILRWAVELGRIDIITEVSILSSHNCAPRKGHLEAAYQMFEFLSDHGNSRVVFDSSYVEIDETVFT